MSNETSVINASMTLTSSAGIVAAVNEYHIFISLSIALLGLIFGLFFHVLTFFHRKKMEKIKTKELRAELKAEIIRDIKTKEDKDRLLKSIKSIKSMAN